MTAELFPHGAVIEGDIRPLDDVPPEDRPEGELPEIEIAEWRDPQWEQAQRAKIYELLLEAKEWTAKAGARGIRTTTRKARHAEASKRVKEADGLIAELLNLDPQNPDDSAAIINGRVRMRQEAVAEQAAKQKASGLGQRANVAFGLDAGRLAAGEGVRNPFDED